MKQTKVIGITGTIGSGKSEVAKIIRNMGYKVLSSDVIAKELMVKNKKLMSKLQEEFGEKVYNDDGSLNKEYLASEVFGRDKKSKEKREKLNSITHPFVIDELIKKVEEYTKEGEDMVFNESALIFEAGMDEGYDYIINVDAPKKVSVKRITERSGISEEEVLQRMKSQFSAEEKKRLADFTIDNSGSLEKLEESAKFTVELVKDLPPKDFEEDII